MRDEKLSIGVKVRRRYTSSRALCPTREVSKSIMCIYTCVGSSLLFFCVSSLFADPRCVASPCALQLTLPLSPFFSHIEAVMSRSSVNLGSELERKVRQLEKGRCRSMANPTDPGHTFVVGLIGRLH